MFFALIIIVFLLIALGYIFAPFPRWSTYFFLWKTVLFNHEEKFSFPIKLQQAWLLIHYALTCPFFTLLWYIDELVYSGYHQGEIKPIFIIGTPRSGTTFIHRNLSKDEKTFFAIRHIEWRYPYLVVLKLIHYFGLEERIKKINYWSNTEAGRKAAKMHPESLFDFEEDAVFFEECFLHHFYIMLRFPYKNLLFLDNFTVLSADEQLSIMNVHKKVIQKIMFLRGDNKIFLSKEVAGTTKLSLIIKMYPNAKFIVNVRPSKEYVSSIIELIRLSTLSKTGIDYTFLNQFKEMYIERMRNDTVQLLEFLNQDNPQPKIIVPFKYLIPYPKNVIEYIYQQFHLTLSAEYQNYLTNLQVKQSKREKAYDYEVDIYPGFESFDQLVNQAELTWGSIVEKK